MVSTSYVFDTLLNLIRKDQHGASFDIDEFNNIIKLINYELYNSYASRLEEDIDVTEALKGFMSSAIVSLTGGVGPLPSDYERMIGKPVTAGAAVDMVTQIELSDRVLDELTQPTVEHPIGMLGGISGSSPAINILPVTTTTVAISYLKLPATPFLDYYVAESGLYVYLDEDATSISVPSGAVYRDGTAGPTTVANSATVDFEWHEHQTPILIDMILQKAGIVLEKQGAVQYGMAKETKEEQQ